MRSSPIPHGQVTDMTQDTFTPLNPEDEAVTGLGYCHSAPYIISIFGSAKTEQVLSSPDHICAHGSWGSCEHTQCITTPASNPQSLPQFCFNNIFLDLSASKDSAFLEGGINVSNQFSSCCLCLSCFQSQLKG